MFEKDVVLELLGSADSDLAEAQETLQEIRKDDDGSVADLRQKRRAVRKALDKCGDRLAEMRDRVAAFTEPPAETEADTDTPDEIEPPAETDTEAPTELITDGEPEIDTAETRRLGREVPPAETDTVLDVETDSEPEPIDLIDLADQHAVSKLMQDSAVHLAVKRTRNFWEIRHRNTPDGRPSDAIRAATIAAAYQIYDQQAIRRSGFEPFEPRRLTLEEQQALLDFQAIARDNPRSVRWEITKTEVDFLDNAGGHGGGSSDSVEFEPGELVRPIEHLKTVLG